LPVTKAYSNHCASVSGCALSNRHRMQKSLADQTTA